MHVYTIIDTHYEKPCEYNPRVEALNKRHALEVHNDLTWSGVFPDTDRYLAIKEG